MDCSKASGRKGRWCRSSRCCRRTRAKLPPGSDDERQNLIRQSWRHHKWSIQSLYCLFYKIEFEPGSSLSQSFTACLCTFSTVVCLSCAFQLFQAILKHGLDHCRSTKSIWTVNYFECEVLETKPTWELRPIFKRLSCHLLPAFR